MSEIAQTILSQIKTLDTWALARWGAHGYLSDNNKLIIITKTNHKQTKIIIELDEGSDTYNIEYGRVDKNHQWVVIDRAEYIYFVQLVEVIDQMINTH